MGARVCLRESDTRSKVSVRESVSFTMAEGHRHDMHRHTSACTHPIDLMCLDDCLSESSWIDLERGVLAPGAGVSTVEPGVGVSTVEPGAGVSTVYECDQYQLG